MSASLAIPVPCTFLQNGRASTIYEAIDRGAAGFGFGAIKALASRVTYVFVSQVPDAAKANGRCLAFFSHSVAGLRNVLENPLDQCCVHQVHLAMTSAVREDGGTGSWQVGTCGSGVPSHAITPRSFPCYNPPLLPLL